MEILVSLGATSTVEGACSFSVLRRLSRCVTTGERAELTWLEVEGKLFPHHREWSTETHKVGEFQYGNGG